MVRKWFHILWLTVAALVLRQSLTSCASDTSSNHEANNVENTRLPDTLKVATLYGPLSFFFFREDTMGYDFALAKDFAASKKLILEVNVIPSIDSAVNLLKNNKIDLIAYSVPQTAGYADSVAYCGPEFVTSQILVQKVDKDRPLLTDVTQLVNRPVSVLANTKFQQRIENLNEEIGGGIDIRLIDGDSITQEDIVEMVSTGKIARGVVDSDIAALNKTYFRNIDISLPVSFGQKSAWAVNNTRPWLADSITAWFNSDATRQRNDALLKRYFELSKYGGAYSLQMSLSKGRISPYDNIFKKQAKRLGWDWRLLASMGFIESRFNNDLVSWAGARGIMQIMPSTARAYGVNPDELIDPETCIRVAVDGMLSLDKSLKKHISDPTERQKFIVAAYNSGIAHIIDAIALANKYGRNPDKWENNVENALLLKGDPAYFNDSVVKYGYFRGRQTTTYVREVFSLYDRIKHRIKK